MFLRPRFRKKTARLNAIANVFRNSEKLALHPDQISRQLGFSLQESHRILDSTPELFVRLPRGPDRITKYALAPSFASLTPEQGTVFIAQQARKESLIFWSIMLIYLVAGLALLTGVIAHLMLWRGGN